MMPASSRAKSPSKRLHGGRFDACSPPLLLVASPCGCRPRARRRGRPARRRTATLGAVARPGRPGHRPRRWRAARVERDQERRLVGRDSRARALLARGVGRPHLPDHGHRGRRRARRQGRPTRHGGPGLPAPRRRRCRSRAGARATGARRGERQDPVAEDRLEGSSLRHAPQARQLRLADAGHRRQTRLRVLRVGRALRLRLRGPARVELEDGRHRELRRGRRHLAGPLREAGDPPVRRGQRRELLHRRASTARAARRSGARAATSR